MTFWKKSGLTAILLVASGPAVGCGQTVTYATETTFVANQVEDAWQDNRYRYVATSLTGTASAPLGSAESKELGRLAMDRLVTAAKLQRNQALVGVTIEQGIVGGGGDESIRVVTLRGDVIEFLPRAEANTPATVAAPPPTVAPPTVPSPPPAPPVAPLSGAGCTSNDDCKGDRVCSQGECVSTGD